MNNSFYLQQIQKTSNLDSKLLSRQYKLNLMADIMRKKKWISKIKTTSNTKSNRFINYYFTKIQKRYKHAFTIQN